MLILRYLVRLLSKDALGTDEGVGLKLRRKIWAQNLVLGIIKLQRVNNTIGTGEAVRGNERKSSL